MEEVSHCRNRAAVPPLAAFRPRLGGPLHIHHGWINVESPATNAEQQVSREQEIVRRTIDKTINSDPAH